MLNVVQLLADEQRGFAWTRALQGVAANEIHVCGTIGVVPLVQQLCKLMGETVEVNHYERFTPLEVEKTHLKNGYAGRFRLELHSCVFVLPATTFLSVYPIINYSLSSFFFNSYSASSSPLSLSSSILP